jgi:hypothetical protein
MATVIGTRGRFDIGRVIRKTFTAIGRNLPLYLGLSFLLIGLPTLEFQLVAPAQAEGIAGVITAGRLGRWMSMFMIFMAVIGLLRTLLTATLVRATVQELNNRHAQIGDSVATGLRALIPVVLMTVIAVIGVMVGLIFFVVPGFILMVAWCLAIPVKVTERTGIFESLSRSWSLTSGNRWKIFWLILITSIVMSIIEGAVVATLAAVSQTTSAMGAAIMASIVAAFGTTLTAAMYVELRMVKEGTDVQALADVFS